MYICTLFYSSLGTAAIRAKGLAGGVLGGPGGLSAYGDSEAHFEDLRDGAHPVNFLDLPFPSSNICSSSIPQIISRGRSAAQSGDKPGDPFQGFRHGWPLDPTWTILNQLKIGS